MNETLLKAAALIVPLVFAIVFHEVAHGYVAKLLGDPTASDRKRLSLNPLRHVDPIGTVILPGILALLKAPVFGWAKPVPVNKWRLRNPRSGMMLVAAAGPGTNLVMAGLGAVLLGLLARVFAGMGEPSAASAFIAANLYWFIQINVFLALFNLIPIPPFDGSHIVEGMLPRDLAERYAQLHRFGFTLVFLLLIVLPSLIPGFDLVGRYLIPPVTWMIDQYMSLATAVAGGAPDKI
ncbi:MAG: site-2 protease family protein [Novosphingobium sp.]